MHISLGQFALSCLFDLAAYSRKVNSAEDILWQLSQIDWDTFTGGDLRQREDMFEGM